MNQKIDGILYKKMLMNAAAKVDAKKQALNDVKNEVSSMAIGIASAIIERDVSESEHRDFIDDFINNIGNE